MSSPYCAISSENIDCPAMSSVSVCIAPSRSTGASAAACRSAIATCVRAAMWRASIGITRGASAGAMVRRWWRQLLAFAEQQAVAGDRAQEADAEAGERR